MMKNKLYNIAISCLMLGLLCSCYDNLDRELRTTLTQEQIEKEYEYTRLQAMSLYTDLEEGFFAINNAMRASICDEAEYTYKGGAETFNTGSWNALSNPDDAWDKYFVAIRKVNLYLAPREEVNLDAYKNDDDPNSQAIYIQRVKDLANWKREARFLRAYYYFELIKRYGGVPIMTEPLTLDSDFSAIQRNSLDDCVKFIVDECNALTNDPNDCLPVVYDENNLGRATKGAALALKSRILLYAASDLWNDPSWAQGYSNPELISLSNGTDGNVRQQRWKDAANAAKAVIDLGEAGYALGSDYSKLGKTFEDPELIFVRRSWAKNDFERLNFPIGYPNGQGSVTPSQNLVDAYIMTDGSKFNWNNEDHKNAPFANRDPRFEMTIYHDGSQFRETYLQCYESGANKAVANGTKTGYYLKKFVDADLDLSQNRTSIHTWIFFRLGEIYLNYAEALNEYNPSSPDVVTYASKTRQRNGINMPAFSSSLDQDEMREAIRNERRVELAFEDHRCWDVRRWMVAAKALNEPLYGVKIETGKLFSDYSKVEIEKRVFKPQMYFYPIPQSMMSTENVNWSQNPLW